MHVTEANLLGAIDTDRLALHFQPRMSHDGQHVIGAEALLRWSPDGAKWIGIAGLDSFSPHAFKSLWRWKMHRLADSFRQLEACLKAAHFDQTDFFIALNLSCKQLADSDWALELVRFLDSSKVPGARVEVELTEVGGAIDAAALAAFDMVRRRGVSIALDDFPEGGASLLRLAQMRFDKVKIDRCMIPQHHEDLLTWMRKRSILEDLAVMIMRARSSMVIEGIECESQLRFLEHLPAAEWQGFFWGRAIPIAELIRSLPASRHASGSRAHALRYEAVEG